MHDVMLVYVEKSKIYTTVNVESFRDTCVCMQAIVGHCMCVCVSVCVNLLSLAFMGKVQMGSLCMCMHLVTSSRAP